MLFYSNKIEMHGGNCFSATQYMQFSTPLLFVNNDIFHYTKWKWKKLFKKTVNLRHRKSRPISRMLTNHRQTLLIFLVLMNNSCLILIDYFILSIWTYTTIDHDNDNDLVYILHLTSFLIEH